MSNIESLFVPYEQALELKELGFDEPCLACYYEDRTFAYHPDSDAFVDAPLYQQAFSFFREKHGLHSYIKYDNVFLKYSYTINDEFKIGISTYKQAELECLKKLIEITKNK